MQIIDEYYKQELHVNEYIERKVQLDNYNYQIIGISQAGKTMLIKQYLKMHKKSSYIYIDLSDIRLDIATLNKNIQSFCTKNNIEILVYEHYNDAIFIPNIKQVILTCKEELPIFQLETLYLYPLDFEEFLAYEHNFDSTALNHFIKLGSLPVMHTLLAEEQTLYMQQKLQGALSEIELALVVEIAQSSSLKLSPFNLYTKIKEKRKISKDSLYKSFECLQKAGYLHVIEKYLHPKAIKKIYLADVSFIYALSISKNFIRIFETLVALELIKKSKKLYYDEGISFYVPQEHRVILCMPFADERALFKRIESIEAFIFTHQVQTVEAVTMSSETSLSHPIARIEMIEFSRWALMD